LAKLPGKGRPSAGVGQTVRELGADQPKKQTEPPVAHHEEWTIRRLPMDHPPNLMHQKSTDKMDRTNDTKELMTNTKNTWLKASSRTVRTGLADRSPKALTAARARPFVGQQFLPFTRSLESTKGKLPIIGEGEAPPGDAMPTNLEPQIH
jgi:hypothetical protein